ncbi:MAG TPA: peptidase S8, partial [Candidatus Dormibacteraeota bacterium]|nr:peptidase S8 [Candidatus Dormibacteraeota bacterium]
SFVPATISTSGNSSLTVTTAANTPVGSYAVTITGTTASLTHSASVTLVVTSAGDFALSASQATVHIARGGTGTDTITVSALQGFTGSVSLRVSGMPARVTATLSATTVTGSGSSVLTVHAGKRARTGTYTMTITGTSGNLSHSMPITLVVQ